MGLQPCGTWAAYLRHRRAGETPCEPCKEANRERSRQRYAEQGRRKPPPPSWHGQHRICPQCEAVFELRQGHQRWCSPECRTKFRNHQPRGSRAHRQRAEQREAFVRPYQDGRPLIGPQRVVRVRRAVLPLGGVWVFCPWCTSLTVRRTQNEDLWHCSSCDLDIELRGVPG